MGVKLRTQRNTVDAKLFWSALGWNLRATTERLHVKKLG